MVSHVVRVLVVVVDGPVHQVPPLKPAKGGECLKLSPMPHADVTKTVFVVPAVQGSPRIVPVLVYDLLLRGEDSASAQYGGGSQFGVGARWSRGHRE